MKAGKEGSGKVSKRKIRDKAIPSEDISDALRHKRSRKSLQGASTPKSVGSDTVETHKSSVEEPRSISNVDGGNQIMPGVTQKFKNKEKILVLTARGISSRCDQLCRLDCCHVISLV